MCLPEVRHNCPGAPVILVGTQMDLREDKRTVHELDKMNQKPVSTEQGEHLALEVGATQYMECSALTKRGLRSVFEAVVTADLAECSEKNKKNLCYKCVIV